MSQETRFTPAARRQARKLAGAKARRQASKHARAPVDSVSADEERGARARPVLEEEFHPRLLLLLLLLLLGLRCGLLLPGLLRIRIPLRLRLRAGPGPGPAAGGVLLEAREALAPDDRVGRQPRKERLPQQLPRHLRPRTGRTPKPNSRRRGSNKERSM